MPGSGKYVAHWTGELHLLLGCYKYNEYLCLVTENMLHTGQVNCMFSLYSPADPGLYPGEVFRSNYEVIK